MTPEMRKKLVELQAKASLASIAIPSPFGDVVGLGADALGYAVDPSQRTPLNFGFSAAGLLPFVPASSVLRRATDKVKDVRPELFDDEAADLAKRALDAPTSQAGRTVAATINPEEQFALARSVLSGMPKRLDYMFDAEKGIGQVPNNLDIAKKGRVEYMTPDQYLAMADKLDRPSKASLEHIRSGLAEGKKLGQPTLTIDVVKGVPQVVNHDGRHRSMVIRELFGPDALIPVHVLGDKSIPIKAVRPQASPSPDDVDEALKRVDALFQARRDKKAGALDMSSDFMTALQKELGDVK